MKLNELEFDCAEFPKGNPGSRSTGMFRPNVNIKGWLSLGRQTSGEQF
jgi:hypothetical protein